MTTVIITVAGIIVPVTVKNIGKRKNGVTRLKGSMSGVKTVAMIVERIDEMIAVAMAPTSSWCNAKRPGIYRAVLLLQYHVEQSIRKVLYACFWQAG
jgi:hypothetical protein